ncbi:hypothetical protein MCC93_24900 [Morococcus cerebrosus]|uniref:Uncharacterized protein n=1 Tax=Morococcus cerebrosus TaxID=1056807 RepID=A0A0C1E2V1_9NEIS|nr:hypothetical protein MCC93_24900 [Morococcus cerebrosus]
MLIIAHLWSITKATFPILYFLINHHWSRYQQQPEFYSIAWRQKRKRSSETEFTVSDDLLSQQQPCSFPRPAGES